MNQEIPDKIQSDYKLQKDDELEQNVNDGALDIKKYSSVLKSSYS